MKKQKIFINHSIELKWRFIYLFFSFFFCIFISYIYKESILLNINPLLKSNLIDLKRIFIDFKLTQTELEWSHTKCGRASTFVECFWPNQSHGKSAEWISFQLVPHDGAQDSSLLHNIFWNEKQLQWEIIKLKIENSKNSFIFTHITEAFFSYLKMSIMISFIFCIPLFIWQFILFLKPGLYKRENKKLNKFLFSLIIIYSITIFIIYLKILYPFLFEYFYSFSYFSHHDNWVNPALPMPTEFNPQERGYIKSVYPNTTTMMSQPLSRSPFYGITHCGSPWLWRTGYYTPFSEY